jgi:hypothetical protein
MVARVGAGPERSTGVLEMTTMMTRLTIAAAAAVLALSSERVAAQRTTPTEPRFSPFVGCWRADSSANRGTDLRCVAPIAGSADVEIVDLSSDRIAGRRRVAASGRPTVVEDGGCRGEEQASWSSLPRRVYLRGEFTCGPENMTGGRTTLMSILPSGEWLEVERIQSGGGSLLQTTRWRDAGVPADVPRDVASRIGSRRLAIATSRADAAAPLTSADVLDALRHTDTAVVREWLVATGQLFRLKGDEVAALVRAGVTSSVLRAMLSGAPDFQLGTGTDANGRSTNAYLGASVVAPAPVVVYENTYISEPCCAAPVYSTYPGYYYYAPYATGIIVGGGVGRRPFYGHAGPGTQRPSRPAPPAYTGKPVGVRPQPSATQPRAVPSRPRP